MSDIPTTIKEGSVVQSTSPQAQDKGIDPTEFASFKNILWAVVIVMLLMVAQMVIEAWNNKDSSDASLTEQINQQNVEMQQLMDISYSQKLKK